MMMKLPKLYRVVKIRFSSLRMGLGYHGGAMFDCDEMVEQYARRVRASDGWKWQIKGLFFRNWDAHGDIDEECLNENPTDFKIINKGVDE